MAKRGIPDCPVLNPEHDGFGAAKLYRGHPYEEEYTYTETRTTYESNTSDDENDDDFDYDDGDDYSDNYYGDTYNQCTVYNGGSMINVNVNVDVNDPRSVENALNFIRRLKELKTELNDN